MIVRHCALDVSQREVETNKLPSHWIGCLVFARYLHYIEHLRCVRLFTRKGIVRLRRKIQFMFFAKGNQGFVGWIYGELDLFSGIGGMKKKENRGNSVPPCARATADPCCRPKRGSLQTPNSSARGAIAQFWIPVGRQLLVEQSRTTQMNKKQELRTSLWHLGGIGSLRNSSWH